MTVSQHVALTEDVSGPARSAASGVRALTKALTKLFSVEGNDKATARVRALGETVKQYAQIKIGAAAAAKSAKDQERSATAAAKEQAKELAQKLRIDRAVAAANAKESRSAAAAAAKESRRTIDASKEQASELAQKLRIDRAVAAFKNKESRFGAAAAAKDERKAAIASAAAAKEQVRAAKEKQRAAAKAAKDEVRSAKEQQKSSEKWNKNVGRFSNQAPAKKATTAAEPSMLSGMVGSFLGNLGANAISAATNALQGALSMVKDLAIEGARIAINAVDFKENALISLEALLGSQSKASQMYEQILDAADRVGLDKGDALSKFAVLVNKGLSEGTAMRALEAMANLEALGEAGGKQAKKFMKELQSEIDKGSPKAVEKLIEEINSSKIGKLGEKKGATFSRLWGDVAGNFERLFDQVDIGPIKDLLSTVIDTFKDPELKSGISDLFTTIFGELKNVTKDDVKAAIEDVKVALRLAKDAVIAIKDAMSEAKDKAENLATGLGAVKTSAEALGKVTGLDSFFKQFEVGGEKVSIASFVLSQALTTLGAIASTFGGILTPLTQIGEIVNQWPAFWEFAKASLFEFIDSIKARFAAVDLSGEGARIGAGLVNGLINALYAGINPIGSAAGQIASAVTAGLAGGGSGGGGPGAAANAGSLPGHASGGLVTSVHGGIATVSAAPGEGLASIGTGERIVPAGAGGAGGVNLTVQVFLGAGAAGGGDAAQVGGVIADEVTRKVHAYMRRMAELH